MLEITTLGGLAIRRDGEPVTGLATRKVEALLVYLACTGRSHAREVLAEMLWEERTPERSLGNLRVALTRLRKQVGEYLTISRDTVAINSEAGVWLDVAELEESLLAGRTGEVLDLYQGEFLQGFYVRDAQGFEEWVTQERERHHLAVVNALHRQVDLDLAAGVFRGGIEHAQRLLTLDPLLESAHEQMMLLLAASGQRSAALNQYETCRTLLADELGVEPAAEIQETYQLLLEGERPPGIPIAPAARDREPGPVGECPYRGLAVFREEDAPFFFGREGFTEQLQRAVQRQPLVAVIVGSSGSGKSSVVFAGLLPRLREAGDWLIAVLRPTEWPFQALAGALLAATSPELGDIERKSSVQKLATAMDRGDQSLADAVVQILERQSQTRRLLLVVDQFEELYTLCSEQEVRRRFLDALLTAVGASGDGRELRFVLLLTMRADFMGRALAYRPFADALQGAAVMLGPMNREELRAAIEKPAAVQGVALEAGLVERILDDVGEEPGNLPLLEFALTLLWEGQSYGWLTHAGYEGIGRVEGALARYADEVYGGLGEAQREGARQLFVQLVRPGEGTEDTRRIASRAELGEETWGLVQHLAGKRLVVTGQDDAGHETVEVVHEALIQGWGQLRGWMVADRAFRTWQEQLRVALHQWQAMDEDEGVLLRGGPLAEAERWLDERAAELSEAEREFIQAGVALREERAALREARRERELEAAQKVARAERQQAAVQARATKRLRWLAGVLAVVFLLAAGAALFARVQQQQAQEQANARATEVVVRSTAEADLLVAEATAKAESIRAGREARIAKARELSAATISNLDLDAERSVLLALQAVAVTYAEDGIVTREAENALHRAVLASRVQLTLSGHNGWVRSVAFSPDGTRLATASADGTAKVWDAGSGQELLTLSGHDDWLQGIAFSSDGTRLATSSVDGTAKVWDAASGEELLTLSKKSVQLGIFHEPVPADDAEHLGVQDGLGVRVAELVGSGAAEEAGMRLGDIILKLNDTEVRPANYSLVVQTLEPHSDVEIELLRDGKPMTMTATVGEQTEAIFRGVTFSPDGTRLATSYYDDGTVTVWDLAASVAASSGEELLTLAGHVGGIWGIDFSPDGTRLATGSDDGTARVWDTVSGQELLSLPADSIQVMDVAFSPDGTRIATGGREATAKVWDASSGEKLLTLAGHIVEVWGITFSLDGTRIATASPDGTAKVWDAATGEELLTLAGHAERVHDVAFSPDGERLATASLDETAKVWDLNPSREWLTLVHDAEVASIAYSPDGTSLATGSADGTASVWDGSSGLELPTLTGHTDYIGGVTFSPDGTRLATASDDGTAKVWDISPPVAGGAWSGKELLTLSGHSDWVNAIAFSPDGTRLATGGADHTAKIWDAISGQALLSLDHADQVWGVAFSPDGTRLATACSDATGTVWDAASGEALFTLSGHADELSRILFSPDGTQLATASWDNSAKVWDVEASAAGGSGQELVTLTGHSSPVVGLAYSPDGTRLATGSGDGTAKVWDVEASAASATGEELLTLTGHTGLVADVTFSPDGARLATASYDGTARVYVLSIEELVALARQRVTRTLTDEECQRYLHVEVCPGTP